MYYIFTIRFKQPSNPMNYVWSPITDEYIEAQGRDISCLMNFSIWKRLHFTAHVISPSETSFLRLQNALSSGFARHIVWGRNVTLSSILTSFLTWVQIFWVPRSHPYLHPLFQVVPPASGLFLCLWMKHHLAVNCCLRSVELCLLVELPGPHSDKVGTSFASPLLPSPCLALRLAHHR